MQSHIVHLLGGALHCHSFKWHSKHLEFNFLHWNMGYYNAVHYSVEQLILPGGNAVCSSGLIFSTKSGNPKPHSGWHLVSYVDPKSPHFPHAVSFGSSVASNIKLARLWALPSLSYISPGVLQVAKAGRNVYVWVYMFIFMTVCMYVCKTMYHFCQKNICNHTTREVNDQSQTWVLKWRSLRTIDHCIVLECGWCSLYHSTHVL